MTHHVETINYVINFSVEPEKVYDTLLDSDKHAASTNSSANIDPVVGGKFDIMDGYISGKNLLLEKGKRIIQEWITEEWPTEALSSIVDFSFKSVNGGTEMTFIQGFHLSKLLNIEKDEICIIGFQ